MSRTWTLFRGLWERFCCFGEKKENILLHNYTTVTKKSRIVVTRLSREFFGLERLQNFLKEMWTRWKKKWHSEMQLDGEEWTRLVNINTNKTRWRLEDCLGKKNNRLSANDRLNDQLQKQHKFIPQTSREFYEDVRADTDAQTNINDISSGSSKPSCKPYWGS